MKQEPAGHASAWRKHWTPRTGALTTGDVAPASHLNREGALRFSEWLKDTAPSNELRRWFGHDPEKWDEFQRRYFAELDRHPGAWRPLREAAIAGDVTLLYSSHDVEHNNAVALPQYLRSHLQESAPP